MYQCIELTDLRSPLDSFLLPSGGPLESSTKTEMNDLITFFLTYYFYQVNRTDCNSKFNLE